jgi:hypothetical protein
MILIRIALDKLGMVVHFYNLDTEGGGRMISLRLSWTAEQVQGQCVLNPEALPQKTKQTKKITLDIYFGENDTFIESADSRAWYVSSIIQVFVL